ncbi:class A beta-lactamase-related serine hydrolase [Nocardioides carbamazepini]|uniref:serine hydrolase n=1 Tax=Nocardioides carbamazepini TaxID=2854259 RepID=UPI00214A80BD|nr:serine hydrolase [Nocardioides carbamazepini]MCR1783814.1 class A beta-lactamase-related serine hydrolase [Nocardioides carbamazepini]
MSPTEQIEGIFTDAEVTGSVHARHVERDDIEVAVRADDPVVLASVFKIPVALAYARAVVGGRLDATEQVIVPSRYRVGGIGTGGCRDEVRMSLRDLAGLMLTLSDNAATDVILDRVGLEAVTAVLEDLDLDSTVIGGGCEAVFGSMYEDLGIASSESLDAVAAATNDATLPALRACDPRRSVQRSTARDITRLLSAIWNDEKSDPRACAIVRDIMADQVWSHRLTSGFPDGVAVAGKTGTLPGVRNEAGVVTYPDGTRYAVAIFLRSTRVSDRMPAADRAIGLAARAAVEGMRQS